ncbi:MAG: pabB [Myxococcaceae bacterium]|nr:pabB [Myxococcaceae bacterium]
MTAAPPALRDWIHAARTPREAVVRVDDRAWSLTLDAPLLTVPFDRPAGALDALADALDALHFSLPPGGDAHAPVALLWATYDAAWHGASPVPIDDRRPAGDRCPSVYLARVGPSLGAPPEPEATPSALPPFASATDRTAHTAMVESVRASIRDGDVYLVNVTRMIHRPAMPAVDVALRVRRADAPRSMVVHAGEVRIAAMSMELALSWDRRAGVALSRPIKGTRPRHADPAEDAREAEALRVDEKERAENAMAVDVHRNDLGRVAVRGGVTVPVLWGVESHRYVHHLVSTVRAEVDPGLSARAMLSSMLPVGSVTGAPKLAAMATIAALEAERRGLYTGVYGAVFADGRVELSVAIRTLVTDAAGTHYGVGGGIVWDSDPAREWEELLWKQRGVE